MKLYEHISKTFIELNKNKPIKLYVCGPTVYNHVHIGNIRPIICFDVFVRALKALDFEVIFLHNITDIDDKIIQKAKQENKNELELARFYEQKYIEILSKLNIELKNITFARVSDNILEIEKFIEKIVNNNFGYVSNGDVYFDLSKIINYGIVSNNNELKATETSLSNDNKKNVNDFALWKKTNEGINWKTKFSDGRPGWHTECACLIHKYFGDQCDIHGGGIDLRFPHHENENAQNIAVSNKNIAKIWMHIGHVNVNDVKMSKSLNNFILAKDILEKFDANSVRWFFYNTNFTNPLNYSEQKILEIKKYLFDLERNLNVIKSYLIISNNLNSNQDLNKDELLIHLINNFNLPNTITLIDEKLKLANSYLKNNQFNLLNTLYNQIDYLLKEILGIKFKNIHSQKNIDLLLEWNKLKNDKKFFEADEIRKELVKNNLI